MDRKLSAMDYKVVRRPHVVPRAYLRGFALDDIIAMYVVADSALREVPVGKAGVLKDFYARERPDGTRIDDIEWSLEHIDKVAPPILREISQRWPLELQEKAILAEFVGVQMLRGPRWREWHETFTRNYFADVRASGEFEGKQPEGMTLEEAIAEAERELSSRTATLVKMIELSRKATQILGSMHWTLVEFGRPLLVTSDHPVVLWPLGVRSRQPAKNHNVVEGVVNSLEVRFPVSPWYALLMTWLDLPDDDAPMVKGNRDIAANLNAFTVAEAEHQWFHRPGETMPIASGQLLPVSPVLARGYSADLALRSRRHHETNQRIQQKIGDGESNAGIELLTITSVGQAEIVPVAAPPEAESSSDAA
jgi:hypothetical protein